MWATDASYFRVAGWGYYYLVTVMDDYSRFILAWKLQRDMAADSLIDVVQEAVDATGMTEVPVEDRHHQTTLGQRAWLRLQSLSGLPAPGGYPAHLGSALSSPD